MNNFIKEKLLSFNYKRINEQKTLANYKPFIIFEKFIFISGQLPLKDNKIFMEGKVLKELTLKDSKKSIFFATLNMLWNLSDAIDNKNNIDNVRCINIKGYINSSENFDDHSSFFDVCSDLIIQILGKENGSHSRTVVGVNSLPKNSPVEIDGIFAIHEKNPQ